MIHKNFKYISFLLLMLAVLASYKLSVDAQGGQFMTPPPSSSFDLSGQFYFPDFANSYLDTTNPSQKNVAIITDNDTNLKGAIWSIGRMDMSQPFVYQSYLYWGRSQDAVMSRYDGQVGGDGMTFTIQNDPNGVQALGGWGGALGAYNRGDNIFIRNAISFEIDPFTNYTSGDFDAGLVADKVDNNNSRHTAFVQPSNARGSAQHNSVKTFSQYPTIEDSWVPFNVRWTPNGQNGVLEINYNGVISTYTIDNYVTFFGGNFAHLGYTGATGGVTALQAVAVSELPVFSYVLSFDANGGTGTPANQTIAVNSTFSSVTPPTRAGYNFAGWVDLTTGTTWTAGSTLMPARDVVLNAQWTPVTVNVTYDMNGGDQANPSAHTATYGSTINAPFNGNVPTRQGFLFDRWLETNSNTTWNFATSTVGTANLNFQAQWTRNAFTVTYDLNGAPGTSQTATVDFGELLPQPNAVQFTGHSLVGWFDSPTGGTQWNFSTGTMPSSDLVLYARWVPNQYNLSFDMNGDTALPPTTQSVTFNTSDAVEPTISQRVGFSFRGWNTAANGSGIMWDFSSTLMPANDTTLYAQWERQAFVLSFDNMVNNGTNPSSQMVMFEDTADAPPVPVKSGHTFVGWFTEPTAGEQWDFNTNTMPAQNMTLYGQWTINSYTLSFNLNNGEGSPVPSQSIVYDTTDAVAPPIPVRTGYTFDGWSRSTLDDTRWDFDTTRMPARDIVLFARWTVNSYTASFDLNGATGTAPSQISVDFGNLVTKPVNPTREGHTFAGWYTQASGGAPWDFDRHTMPASDLTLYARWNIDSFTMRFDLNGGSSPTPPNQSIVFDTTDAIEPSLPIRDGYTFDGWSISRTDNTRWDFSNSRMPARDVYLYARWVINTYEVTFDLNGGDSGYVDNQVLDYNSLVTEPEMPSRIGHTFIGWFVDPNSDIQWDFLQDRVLSSNITLYARWTINNYEMKFDLNGFDTTPVESQLVEFASLATKPISPEFLGYTFIGWNESPDGSGIIWNFDQNKMPPRDVVLYAMWQINSYDVVFDLNGGIGETPVVISTEYNSLIQPLDTPIREGFTFQGWTENLNSDEIVYWDFDNSLMPARPVNLWAVWQINNYTLSFDLNGAQDTIIESQVVTFGELATLVNTPERAGYTFDGWGYTLDGVMQIWNFETTTMPANDVTLIAQWSVNQHRVDFDLNGGDGNAPVTQNVDFGQLVAPVDDPVREGYKFLGWSTDKETSVDSFWDFAKHTMPHNDIILFAHWQINEYELKFDLNGGTSSLIPSQVIEFEALAIKPSNPIRNKFTFVGWSTKKNDLTSLWDFKTSYMPSHDVVLYAQWKPVVDNKLPITGNDAQGLLIGVVFVILGTSFTIIRRKVD